MIVIDILSFLFLGLLVALIVGLIRPYRYLPMSQSTPSRKQLGLTFGGLILGCLLLIAAIAPHDKAVNQTQADISLNQTPASSISTLAGAQAIIPTSTPIPTLVPTSTPTPIQPTPTQTITSITPTPTPLEITFTDQELQQQIKDGIAIFEKSALVVTISNIAKSPDAYFGKKLKISGRIESFVNDNNNKYLNLADTKDLTSVILVQLPYDIDLTKINKGDNITVWCNGGGSQQATNAFGGTINEGLVYSLDVQDNATGYLY